MVKALYMLCVLCVAAFNAGAQSASVVAQVSSDRVYVGDSITLQITVDGSQSALEPDMSALQDFIVEFLGGSDQSSRSISIFNGKRTEQNTLKYIMQYRLTPTRPGRLVIPPLKVPVAARTYTTSAIQITALEPGENSDFKLQLDLEKPSAYVGEPVLMRLTWYLGKEVRGAVLTGSNGGDDFELLPGPDPRPPGTAQDDRRYPAVPFLGTEAVGALSQGTLDGAPVTTFTIEQIVIPRRSGELRVGPFSAAFDAVIGQRQRTFFDSPWDDKSVTERVVMASPAVNLTVKELPLEGRPATFNGLIGEYSIAAEAENAQANVGDPIPLRITVKGPEPMQMVSPPDLTRQPGFAELFKPSPEGWEAESSQRGARTFTTVVRPKTDKVTSIPPIDLAYFDTATGTYRTASSQPIPLVVNAAHEVTAADAVGGAAFPSATKSSGLTPGPGGLLANYEGLEALDNQQVSLLGMIQTPQGLLVVLGPFALFSAVVVAGRVRSSASGAPGVRRRALRRSNRMLATAGNHDQVSSAIRSFLGAQRGTEPSAITSLDCSWLLKGLQPDLVTRTQQLLIECERSAYGGSSGAVAGLRDQARSLLADLHRELERQP